MMSKEDIMTIKSKFTSSYTELNWNTTGFEDIRNKKTMLCQMIWGEFVESKYSYIKTLFFKRYSFSYCTRHIASYKRILKSDVLPLVIKNASKISEEVNIVSTSDCVVYAIETIAPATESYFEEACSILHDTKNECLVILGNTEEFIPYEYWLSIYNNVSNNMQYVPDFILKNLLSYLNQTDALVCTYGFFDDREAGFSIYQRYNPQGHAGNPTQHG